MAGKIVKFGRRALILATGVLLVLLGAVWLVLSSQAFSGIRSAVVADVLTNQIGQTVLINGDAGINLARVSTVHISDVEIPSFTIPESGNVIQLQSGEFKIDIVSLLSGTLNISDLAFEGLELKMHTRLDGKRTWGNDAARSPKTAADAQPDKPPPSVTSFVSNKAAKFSNFKIHYTNEITGFEFKFDLDDFVLDPVAEAGKTVLTSNGSVNGQPFSIRGDYPDGAPFTTTAEFAEAVLRLDGTNREKAQGGGIDGQLALTVGSFGDFLEVLGLHRSLEGSGELSIDLAGKLATLVGQNLDARVDLETGQSLTVTGSLGDIFSATGKDLQFQADLLASDASRASAKNLKDLRLTAIDAQLQSISDKLEIKDLIIRTNAFESDIERIGPIQIGRIKRSDQGTLEMLEINVQAGPIGNPFLHATGDIHNLLKLKGVQFDGDLFTTADTLLKNFEVKNADDFGELHANFGLTDEPGHLTLSHFNAKTEASDLWAVTASMSLDDITKLEDLVFDLDLQIPDGSAFLTALELEPIPTGPVGFRGAITGSGLDMDVEGSLTLGDSVISANLGNHMVGDIPTLRGGIKSPELRIDDLRNVGKATVQLGTLSQTAKPNAPKPEEEGDAEQTNTKANEILESLDVEFGIDIEKIVGQDGLSKIKSDLEIKKGNARFGPLELHLGGAYFAVNAALSLIDDTKRVQVFGATSGWKLAKIMELAGLKLDAQGTIGASFDVSGDRRSAKRFIDSMYGRANVTMKDGRVATSLIDLAGLGVFPWLFSGSLDDGYTNIVCLDAPLAIKSGVVGSKAMVLDTDRIQLVINGGIDWKNDKIGLRVEPRRIGKPLSRSAFPFEVVGALSAPKFKLKRSVPADRALLKKAREKPATYEPCKVSK